MHLSVIVPTCNERDELTACLDALTRHAPDVETIVVNGPSTDGTSGLVRERDDVDTLLDVSSRNLNVARNAGLREATGEIFALLSPRYEIQPAWAEAITESLDEQADLVSGPVALGETDDIHRGIHPQGDIHIVGGNLALTQAAVRALDGFDEYLMTEGARDLGQRIVGQDLRVIWHPEMRVRVESPPQQHRRQHRGGYETSWQGSETTDWGAIYRSKTYRVVKNQGVRATPRVLTGALKDGLVAAHSVVRDGGSPTGWVSNGASVISNIARGGYDGVRARRTDRTPARNPYGLSQSEADVIVDRYPRAEL